MEELTYYIVEGQIGYNFKNRDLLQQAFVRRSYAKEIAEAGFDVKRQAQKLQEYYLGLGR